MHNTADTKTYATSVYKHLTICPAFSSCSGASQTLCSHCKGREAELYCKTVANGMCFTLLNASTFGSTMPRSSPLTDQISTSAVSDRRCSLGGYGHSARSAKDLCTRTFSVQGLLFSTQFSACSLLCSSHNLKTSSCTIESLQSGLSDFLSAKEGAEGYGRS